MTTFSREFSNSEFERSAILKFYARAIECAKAPLTKVTNLSSRDYKGFLKLAS